MLLLSLISKGLADKKSTLVYLILKKAHLLKCLRHYYFHLRAIYSFPSLPWYKCRLGFFRGILML